MENRSREQVQQEEVARFARLFPQVKPEEIPAEVWEMVRAGQPLTLAYCLDRLVKTQRELEFLKSRRRAQELSTGSVSTAGPAPGGTVAAYWDAYQM